MTFGDFFSRKMDEFVSKTDRVPTPEEYSDLLKAAKDEWERMQKQQREKQKDDMSRFSERLLEFAVELEDLTNSDDLEGCGEVIRMVSVLVFEQLTAQERKEISDRFSVARSRASGGSGIGYKTQERQSEEDPNAQFGKSQIHHLLLRKRNSSADPGNYAGRVCLMTRHGWRPIVVPEGVERLLQDIGIWENYKQEFPLNSRRVYLREEDRFTAEWERLPDGTRSFVKIISAMRR